MYAQIWKHPSRREQRALAAVKLHNLRIERIGNTGAVRIVGPGVHIVAASLRDLTPEDLAPADPYKVARELRSRQLRDGA